MFPFGGSFRLGGTLVRLLQNPLGEIIVGPAGSYQKQTKKSIGEKIPAGGRRQSRGFEKSPRPQTFRAENSGKTAPFTRNTRRPRDAGLRAANGSAGYGRGTRKRNVFPHRPLEPSGRRTGSGGSLRFARTDGVSMQHQYSGRNAGRIVYVLRRSFNGFGLDGG